MMFQPEGVYVAMLTPFKEDGSIHEEEMRRMVDFAVDRGVDGLFPVSSVGEFIHLSQDERVRLMEIVVEQAGGRVRVTPGAGSTHPTQSIALAQKAKVLGCDGVVVAPPHFFTLSQGMIEKYFETIAEAVDIPIVLYNIPLFTTPLSHEVVRRLSHRANIVGMKDSSGSMVDLMHFLDEVRLESTELAILTGREDIFFPALMAGARGCMVAAAGILPEIMVGIYRAWRAGDYGRAKALQFSVLPLIRAMFSLPFPLGFKTALELRGFEMGPPKQPLSDKESAEYQEIRRRIAAIMRQVLEETSEQGSLAPLPSDPA